MNTKDIADLGPDERRALFDRDAGIESIRSDVRDIIERVRDEGDVAVREFSREFDDVEVGNIDITDEAERAYEEIDADVREAIEDAADNIREFHEAQLPDDWRETFDGRELGRRFRPIERVGVYAPGGTAAYPSSALMGVIPAKVAGVEQVAVATPPGDPQNTITLAAIHAAGADRVYRVGGAQAIGAMAYGTEQIDRVQKVVGPGNRWVTAAKAEVQGEVAIDFLAGPSELLVLADDSADPRYVASDMIAQAEHDENASAVTVTDDAAFAEAVVEEIDQQTGERERKDVIRAALDNDASGVFVARSMSEGLLFAEEYAAEHLSIQVENDEELLNRIESAGSVFLGPYTPVAAGDYASGTNHVLPTTGLAKITGGLSVDTFVRSTTVQRLDEGALDSLSGTITTLAEAEGLEAHAESVRKRFE
ncbi:histidinol dehydrogenase [Haladaptatus caseinilyticus]|uniref:histidinol dehydrogenase n=1 Tax=Haladaptatus caseinilyticus TaxID=2993314 RepID=UPI00224AF770|nr:histidinol dehydrogenase [Haladaptatus caseinilyticus]